MTPKKSNMRNAQWQNQDDDMMYDPLEAILALNMGDFVAEHLISEELLAKINNNVANSPDRLKRQLEELVQIYSLKNTLSLLGFSPDDGALLYDSIALSLIKMFQADACHIFQMAQKSDQDFFLGLVGSSAPNIPVSRWHLGYSFNASPQSAIIQCLNAQETKTINVKGLTPQLWQPIKELNQDETVTALAVPLYESNKPMGVMLVERNDNKPFASETIELAEQTGHLLLISLRLQRLLTQAQTLLWDKEPPMSEMQNLRAQITEAIADLSRAQQQFVEVLSLAIDARNDYTKGHSQGVAHLAKQMAEFLNLNEKTVDLVYYAGLLGALGKIDVPQDILNKNEALTMAEREQLLEHPNVGVGLLMKINFLSEVIPYVRHQKERWDGTGSPEKLKGRNIPLGSRILGVCDAYWALRHPRPYREAPLDRSDAMRVMLAEANQKWDPMLIQTLTEMPLN